MIQIIYYAHSMRIYNTDREREELIRLKEYFREGIVYNPNRLYVQESENPMGTCFEIIQDPWITALAFSHNFLRIPSGVYAEIKVAQNNNKPIYIIHKTMVERYNGIIKLTKRDRATDWAMV